MYEGRTQALLSAQKRYRTVLKQTRIDEHGPGTILFGLTDIEDAPPKPGKGCNIQAV